MDKKEKNFFRELDRESLKTDSCFPLGIIAVLILIFIFGLVMILLLKK